MVLLNICDQLTRNKTRKGEDLKLGILLGSEDSSGKYEISHSFEDITILDSEMKIDENFLTEWVIMRKNKQIYIISAECL